MNNYTILWKDTMKRSDIRNFFRALHEGKGFDPIHEGKKGLYCGACSTMNEKDSLECSTCGCTPNEMQLVEFEETAEGRKIIKTENQPSTDKYDDDPALKGGQKNLPDSMQKGIIKKAKKK